MRFYRLQTQMSLFSFGDPMDEVPVDGVSLYQKQEEVLKKCGLKITGVASEDQIIDQEYFVFDEDLVFSVDFIKQAIQIAKKNHVGSLRFCLEPNTFNERYVLPHSRLASEYLKFNFFYRNKKNLGSADAIVLQKVFTNRILYPKQLFSRGFYSYDQCSTFIVKIASPFHLMQANLAFLFLKTERLRRLIPENWFHSWAGVNSKLFFFGLRRSNKIGKNCNIHPTAVIEGAEIGNNVTVGAHSVVRLSKIQDGTTIDEHVVVKYSVLGRNNYISNGNQINGCVSYDDVFLIHGPYQVSIFGKGVTVMAVINCDIRIDQKNITIETPSGLVDSGQPLLGIAYGHGSKIGGGNIIAPGRIVPNSYRLAPPHIMRSSFENQPTHSSKVGSAHAHELT